jgi:hypothetical protein
MSENTEEGLECAANIQISSLRLQHAAGMSVHPATIINMK